MRKQYIEVPLQIESSHLRKIWRRLVGAFLTPMYLIAAMALGTPGTRIHLKCAFIAVRLFLLMRISLSNCYSLIFFPMDSTRYFEFHEVLKRLKHVSFNTILDVSSPRILPLMLLMQNKEADLDMINPDSQDTQISQRFAAALGLSARCSFTNSTIEKVNYAPESFDLITCISVLEHIPTDDVAVEMMWSLIRPGGRLIITLPCMAQPLEQYISHYDYGVLSPESDGYTFWQRYYDDERLRNVIFNITGAPTKITVYGERKNGLFFRNTSMKRLLGAFYPFWRESYMMANEYRYFSTVAELPGEGVVMLEFIKP